MDKGGDMGPAANNSSDFVSTFWKGLDLQYFTDGA